MTEHLSWQVSANLHGYHWPAATPRAAVLLQHGYAEHAGRYLDHYNRLVPALTAAGYDVFAFDLAGHGLSPGDRGVTDIGEMTDAHIAARAEIAARGLPLFLLGHSLGGLVTALSVTRQPAGIAGVILSGPALPFDTKKLLRLVGRVLAKVAPATGVATLGDAVAISRLPEEVQAYRDDPLVFTRAIPALLGATAAAAADEIAGGMAGWRAPTFVFHGTADSYTDPRGSERLVAAIASVDKELWLIEDGRHELLNDEPRDAVLARVVAWIDARVKQ